MTPPPAAAQRTAPARAGRAPSQRAEARRPALHVLDALPRRDGRILRYLAAAVVVASLLAVVVGHSMLAQGQVRLTADQGALTTQQAINRQLLAQVAAAENPARIVAEAKKLGLVTPTSVTQVPAVPLDTPVNVPASAGATSTSTPSSTAPAAQ